MAKNNISVEQEILKKLCLNLNEWQLSIDYGKPFLNNSSNKRSYVCVEVENIPSMRKISLSQKGSFTKKEARTVAEKLVKEASQKLR